MYKPPGKPPRDYEQQELTDTEVTWVRGWVRTTEHLRWLWRTIIRPAAIAIAGTLIALPGAIAALKELIKWGLK